MRCANCKNETFEKTLVANRQFYVCVKCGFVNEFEKSKIEEIKNHKIDRYKFYDAIHGEEYEADVKLLLSIINQADTALSRIADLHIRGIEDRAAEPHREIAKEALKVIRGN